ncbi:MAG: GNAT family N-acetyltransferase [Acidobacteriota bacterium]|nr:GNAT family N-acetyltransferase [Acidobacteriota bacterium]
MIEVRSLTRLDATELKRIASGYSSNSKYVLTHVDSASRASIDLQLVAFEQPFIKKYDHFDAETLQRYNGVLKDNYSFGAYEGALLVGLLIAEARLWNHSLWVCEFHVAETYRQTGIGKRLMECAAEKAKQAGLRIIVCETQNTNAAAISVYRQLGFGIEGIDISYYSNTDYPDGEIAIFMKRRL